MTPWMSQRRSRGGYTWTRSKVSGSVNLRTTRTTESGLKRIYVTVIGKGEVKLASEFIWWILHHFGNDLQRITLTPSK